MPAYSADEEVQQTEPSCSNPAGRQHKPSRCSPRTARKMKNLEKINSRLRKALSRIGKRKVCHYMDCRSKKQLINRYHWSLYPNMQRGRWSAQEDVMLLVAVKLYGDVSWSKVASMVPGRTHGQCRDRYMDNFAQQFVLGPFTSDEDCTLLQLVQKYGAGHWAMAARDMPWRASNTLLMRYRRLYETLRTKEPTVADVERSLAVPVAPMTAVRCARLTGMDKRMDLYRRIRRLLNTDVMKRAALSLVKNWNENVSRETCMRLYRKMLQFQQGTRPPKNSQMQGRFLTKVIAKYAQPLHQPMLPSLAACEHQEWQAVANVLHDLHGLSRPPPNPEVEKVGTVPIFEKLFSKEVLGVPDAFETKEDCLVLPLLPPNETTVATYGRLLDRFDSGSIVESLLVGNNKFPELSAAFNTESAEYICCTECVSRSLLEISSGAPVPCSRCKDVRAMRKSYDVLQARVISYFFWPAVLDSMNVAETVELPAEPARKRAKIYRRKAKLKKTLGEGKVDAAQTSGC
ncbi:uncharacterized protein LOC142790045 isoform X1 [Rhipicephalus microplus]|uniref:uncharacterized protein LOC142790045 isoform X1 n=1 Tax=Rhipicephalus microplus TaxID=6941 RepID=UPI003F6C223B